MVAIPDKLKRRVLVIAGTLALMLGFVGIILPVLPTTPFLILAAICYMRGSQWCYNSLLRNRFIGKYLKNYLSGRGMSLTSKILTMSLLWITILSTVFLLTENPVVKVVLAVVLVGVTIHILLIKTLRTSKSIDSRRVETP